MSMNELNLKFPWISMINFYDQLVQEIFYFLKKLTNQNQHQKC